MLPFDISTVKTEKHSRGAVDLGARDARAPRKKGVARPEAVGLEVLIAGRRAKGVAIDLN